VNGNEQLSTTAWPCCNVELVTSDVLQKPKTEEKHLKIMHRQRQLDDM